MRPFGIVCGALLLAGCATTAIPYGEFDGFNNRNAADPDLDDVVVMAVDGKLPDASSQGVVSLTPGVHLLALASSRDTALRPSGGTVLHPSRDTVHGRAVFIDTLIKVEPCRRYLYRAAPGNWSRQARFPCRAARRRPPQPPLAEPHLQHPRPDRLYTPKQNAPTRPRVHMTKASSTNWEIAIDLPLGVVASQLARIEEQLRLLNLKAADLVKERDGGRRNGAISVRLENINRALDSIRTFMSDLETEIDATRLTSDAVFVTASGGKPRPERDD